MRIRRKHPVGANAFTLLELILIMIILCTVLAMAAPSLRGFFSSRQLNDITEQILAMTRYAKVQSVFESRYYRVNFDPQQRLYWISSRRESQYQRLDSNFGNLYSIPADIDIAFDNVSYDNGIYYFEFDPEGYSKEAAVRLRDNQDTVHEVVCYSPAENYEIVEIINGKERYQEEKKDRR
jgi:Tfp pilus assembly protein FimT